MSSTYGGTGGQDPLTGGPDPYGSAGYPQGQGYPEEGLTEGGASAAGYGASSAQTGYTGAESASYQSTYSTGGASTVGDQPPDVEDESVGSLVGRLTGNLSKLMRQELELAKVEVRDEAKKAGAAVGMLAAAGVAGLLLLICLSLTVIWLLDTVMYQWLAALIVTVLWAIIAAVLGLNGKKKLSQVNPKPEQTIETLKEDKEWVQAQRS
jgi:uncharacterized membrane protein YqjE